MNYPFRAFEPFGIYISLMFSQNLDRTEAWNFRVETKEDHLFTSKRYYNFKECEIAALQKAAEYLTLFE